MVHLSEETFAHNVKCLGLFIVGLLLDSVGVAQQPYIKNGIVVNYNLLNLFDQIATSPQNLHKIFALLYGVAASHAVF